MSCANRLEPMFALIALLPGDVGRSMVAMYRDALVGQVELLRQALEAGQAQQLNAIAHKIAGSAAMMRDQELSHAARAIEALPSGSGLQELAPPLWLKVHACAQFTLDALEGAYPPDG